MVRGPWLGLEKQVHTTRHDCGGNNPAHRSVALLAAAELALAGRLVLGAAGLELVGDVLLTGLCDGERRTRQRSSCISPQL